MWLVCDEPAANLTLRLETFLWTSLSPTSRADTAASCPGPGAAVALQLPLSDLLATGRCHPGSYDQQRLEYCLVRATLLPGEGPPLHMADLHAPPLALSTLLPPQLSVTVTGLSNTVPAGRYTQTFAIRLTTTSIALYVWLESGRWDGRFSENGFIAVDEETELLFHSEQFLTVEQLQLEISVRAYRKPQWN